MEEFVKHSVEKVILLVIVKYRVIHSYSFFSSYTGQYSFRLRQRAKVHS